MEEDQNIHTRRGWGFTRDIRAGRTRRVDVGIWRDSHCLPYYVTGHMYSLLFPATGRLCAFPVVFGTEVVRC